MTATHYPHITVAAVVRRDDEFLMVRERIGTSEVYNQPAGHLELGESLLDAAVRETLEETAWQIELTGLLGLRQYYAQANGVTYIRVSFTAKPVQQFPQRRLDKGILGAHWLKAEQIKNLSSLRSPLVWLDVAQALAGEVYPVTLVKTVSTGKSII